MTAHHMAAVLPTKWLPNQDGFLFLAVCRDGHKQKCKVIRRRDGQHRVRGVKFDEIIGWRNTEKAGAP